jgi:four helix bundle protein
MTNTHGDLSQAPFDGLRAFEASYDLGLAIYKSTERWPRREIFGLSAQARRAASSISINLAEGSIKKGDKEWRRFLDISLGSLAELQVILRFARDLEFIGHEEVLELEGKRAKTGRMTWHLYRKVMARLNA